MSELVLDVERQYQGGNVLTITFTDRIYVNLLIITLLSCMMAKDILI